MKLFDFAVDADLSALFEAIGMKVELVKPHEIPFHMTTRLNPQQLVVINNLYHPQPKEVFAVSNFIQLILLVNEIQSNLCCSFK